MSNPRARVRIKTRLDTALANLALATLAAQSAPPCRCGSRMVFASSTAGVSFACPRRRWWNLPWHRAPKPLDWAALAQMWGPGGRFPAEFDAHPAPLRSSEPWIDPPTGPARESARPEL